MADVKDLTHLFCLQWPQVQAGNCRKRGYLRIGKGWSYFYVLDRDSATKMRRNTALFHQRRILTNTGALPTILRNVCEELN